MFNATYTGMVLIFLIIQSGGFAFLVWRMDKEIKSLRESLQNCKDQGMVDSRALSTLIGGLSSRFDLLIKGVQGQSQSNNLQSK